MKKILLTFATSFAALSASLSGQMIESSSLTSVLNVADDQTIVFFNVTDTLYISSNTIGTFEWREYVNEKVREWVRDPQVAENILVNIKRDTMTVMPKMLVDKNAPEVIQQLHKNKIPTLGFTSKNRSTPWLPNFDEVVKSHLMNLGIDFADENYFTLEVEDNGINPYIYAGVVFAEGRSKVEAVKSVLREIQPQIKKVVFVDDRKVLLEMEAALEKEQIEFTGIRFSASDSIKDYRDMRLGIIQFEQFLTHGSIMSDEAAELVLKDSPSKDYDALLKTLVETYY